MQSRQLHNKGSRKRVVSGIGRGGGGRLTQQDLHDNAPEIAFPCRREVGGFPNEIRCL